MASSSNQTPLSTPPLHMNFDPNINSTPNTTFVQADPSNFRAVVQRLTGATPPATFLAGKPNSSQMGPHRSTFKLHERRQSARKLEIKLNDNNNNNNNYNSHNNAAGGMNPSFVVSPSCGSRQIMVSPVSTLEYFLGRGSPRTPMSPQEEEERAIAHKGFYLHPSPRGTPRGGIGSGGGTDPPQLLPLFPLQSPRSNNNNSPSSNLLIAQSP